jgi:hypothetical protein
MRADEFLARLQQVRDGKQMVDLLVQASIVAPPLRCPYPPQTGTKVAPMSNTAWVPAGTHGDVAMADSVNYLVTWATGKKEWIDKETHDRYALVCVYEPACRCAPAL